MQIILNLGVSCTVQDNCNVYKVFLELDVRLLLEFNSRLLKHCNDIASCKCRICGNPTFWNLLLSEKGVKLYKMLEDDGLITTHIFCEVCAKPCKVINASSRKGGKLLLCRGRVTWKHERNYSACKRSIFKGVHLDIHELLVFKREQLLGSSLQDVSSGPAWTIWSPLWIEETFLGDHCSKFVNDLYYESHEKLRGEIEIDKSLFSRWTKYHCEDPQDSKVWIFGMVECSSNAPIFYPVHIKDGQ